MATLAPWSHSAPRSEGVQAAPRRTISREAGILWLAIASFIGVSAWWFTQDDRVPIWDQGSHLNTAWQYGTALQHGHYLEWFTSYTTYPPLAHLVGAFAYLIGGMHPMAMEMAANIVFVPLLAFGCFGVGRLLGGPRAGLLAGLFGLGTPMFTSMMHGFYVDPPQAAMVAVAIWALLASRHFERVGVSALAGLLVALAMLTKQTSVLFLGGPVAVTLMRGGWRRPRGIAAFAVFALGVGLPWYVYHWSQITGTFAAASGASGVGIAPSRYSLSSIGWYFWNLVNQQIMLPFTVLFAVGVVSGPILLWRARRTPGATGVRRWLGPWLASDDLLPELLVGAVVAYLGVTYVGLKDPRYTLPGLVYVATLSTFWIPRVRLRWLRLTLSAATVALAVFYFVGMSFGIGNEARVSVTVAHDQLADNPADPGILTLYEDQGWLRGAPAHDGNVLALLKGLHLLGITYVTVDQANDGQDFSFDGINPLAPTAGLVMTAAPLNAPHTAYLFQHTPTGHGPAPCQRMRGNNAVYVLEGDTAGFDAATLSDPTDRRQRYVFICPGRAPEVWPR